MQPRQVCGAGRSGSAVQYAPLLDALSAQLKQLHWEEASGYRQAPGPTPVPGGDTQLPASPTASQLYGMPGYQIHPQQHMFQPPTPGNWQGHPAGYPPQYSGFAPAAAAAPDLADQEPFPYFMQARYPTDSCLQERCIVCSILELVHHASVASSIHLSCLNIQEFSSQFVYCNCTYRTQISSGTVAVTTLSVCSVIWLRATGQTAMPSTASTSSALLLCAKQQEVASLPRSEMSL